MIVTVARYRAITGDDATATATVSAKLERAIDMLADELDRPEGFDEAERTERLWPTRDGYLWPSHLPLVSCSTYDIDGDGLVGTFGPAWPDDHGGVTVTYTGGWVERSANPWAANRLPAYVEEDIAWAAWALAQPANPSAFPAGATSVRLGDAAVTFGPDGAPANPGVGRVKWSRRTLSHRSRTTRGTGTTAVAPWS